MDTIHSVVVADLTPEELKELQGCTSQDAQLTSLLKTITQGWPELKQQWAPEVRAFWDYRDELSHCNGIQAKGPSDHCSYVYVVPNM